MVGPAVTRKLPLTGIKVLELAGLAPVPFAGMVLADFGANVCRVSKTNENFTLDSLGRGKKSICVDLKSQVGRNVFKRLVSNSDVLIEPFRPGVMEKLKIGPENLFKLNERLIYTRINGKSFIFYFFIFLFFLFFIEATCKVHGHLNFTLINKIIQSDE